MARQIRGTIAGGGSSSDRKDFGEADGVRTNRYQD